MTLEEALAESMRRNGGTEENIREAMQRARILSGVPEKVRTTPVPEEHLEDFISALARFHLACRRDPDSFRNAINGMLWKRNADN